MRKGRPLIRNALSGLDVSPIKSLGIHVDVRVSTLRNTETKPHRLVLRLQTHGGRPHRAPAQDGLGHEVVRGHGSLVLVVLSTVSHPGPAVLPVVFPYTAIGEGTKTL